MDLEQLEAFVLDPDRERVLAQLIPGTEDYYYYHCLHYQHTGQLDKSHALLDRWIKRHGDSARVREISHRQALHNSANDLEECLRYLRQVLHLRFDHQRQDDDSKRAFSTSLASDHVARDVLMQRAFQQHRNLAGFTDAALDWLIKEPLEPTRRRHLLERLERPDYPELVDHILADLAQPDSAGFGSLPIHRRLLRQQLDELARKRDSLLSEQTFVHTLLARLRPGPETDWERDVGARREYLDRLWAFAADLAPSFNSLKAHVLYHSLALGRAQGIYDRERLLTYLQLPREVAYVPAANLERTRHRDHIVEMGADFPTGLPPVDDDEPLVRDYLAHFFAEDDDYRAFEPYVRNDYLVVLFATTKILHGVGDGERWYAMLDDPGYYQDLKDRVDIEFAPTNAVYFGVDDAVIVEVDIKNVATLVVKVFEINTLNYYLTQEREIDTTIDLDGLVASEETSYEYSEPPLRRVRRRFSFAQLTKPGVYVIEFIGGGKSSRAVIRKGRLHYVDRQGAAGHNVTIIDEDNRVVSDAGVWLGDREYKARDDGTIVIPYTTKARRRTIILRHGDLTTRDTFYHQGESYQLAAGIYVDREQLVAGAVAQVLLRPVLYLNSTQVSLALVDQPTLVIETVDRHGVRASKEVTPCALAEDSEAVHEFQVPSDLVQVTVTVRGKVRSMTENRDITVSAAKTFKVNRVDTSHTTECFYLSCNRNGYVLHVLGKTGEPHPATPVTLSLRHRDFQRPNVVNLQTDDRGRIELGTLTDIVWIAAASPTGAQESRAPLVRFSLTRDRVHCPRAIHACVGDEIAIPYTESEQQRLSLLERRGEGYVTDWSHLCQVRAGYVLIRDLPVGNYDLWLAVYRRRIDLRITQGQPLGAGAETGNGADPGAAAGLLGWLAGPTRMLERSPRRPLHVTSVTVDNDALTIHLDQVSRMTRVHVFANRFVLPYALADCLQGNMLAEPGAVALHTGWTRYVSGRELGDEYRYVLDRKQLARFPGNMQARPGLLLNPWAVRKTDTDRDQTRPDAAYGAVAEAEPSRPAPRLRKSAQPSPPPEDPATFDFLAESGIGLVNLRAEVAAEGDTRGVIRIARQRLGGCSVVRIFALDGASFTYREVTLPEVAPKCRDLRLQTGLEPETHFVEKKQITILGSGDALTIADMATARVEVYDTLTKVFDLLATLSENPTLAEFRFILRWPQLDESEKRAYYSKYACHELNLFLWRKDVEFFDRVIRPHLGHKKDKTFVDHFLLGDDLHTYREPWAYGRLNRFERILLAHRVAGERAPGRRHIDDQCELLAPDPEGDDRLFRTALQRSSLEPGDDGGPGGASPEVAPAPAGGPATMSLTGFGTGAARARPAPRAQVPSAAMLRAPGAPAAAFGAAEGGMASEAVDEDTDVDMHVDELDLAFAAKSRREADDVVERRRVQQLYRPVDKTEEWAENNYYRLPIAEQGPELTPVHAFWRDFAHHEGTGPFLSGNVTRATANFAEMMCALAVLDLPFVAGSHQVTRDNDGMRLVATTPALVFHEEIKAARPSESRVPIQVSQQYIRLDDRYRHEGGEQITKYVTGELLLNTVYLCHVVLTNPISAPQVVDVLLQIPVGALAVGNGWVTRGQRVRLNAYSTHSLEYGFYFAEPGTYEHYPARVAVREHIVAAAPSAGPLTVVSELREVDTESWAYVSQHGSDDQVLAYLAAHNLERLALDKLAWRMGDRKFYDAVLAHLSERHVYHRTLWSYSLEYGDRERIGTFLRHEDKFLRECGLALRCDLIDIDPVLRQWYEHLEYAPFINARIHPLRGRQSLRNQALAAQYRRLLDVLACQPEPGADGHLAVAYYLLLQDRIAEALDVLARVDANAVSARLQYDYIAAIAAMYRSDLTLAQSIAESHSDYPVDRWRQRFADIIATIDEARRAITAPESTDTAATTAPDYNSDDAPGEPVDATAEHTRLAQGHPTFDMAVDAGQVTLTYQNLRHCRVNYYLMDIELLFSRQPFLAQASERFSLVKPNKTQEIDLPADDSQYTFALPEAYQRRNIVLEVVAEGMRKSLGHYAHSLMVQLVAPYGQVRVFEQRTREPIPACYVKVYARMHDGDISFYKDGYTDVRGCFDYASLSSDQTDRAERFAILILTEEHGAVIREVEPPQR